MKSKKFENCSLFKTKIPRLYFINSVQSVDVAMDADFAHMT